MGETQDYSGTSVSEMLAIADSKVETSRAAGTLNVAQSLLRINRQQVRLDGLVNEDAQM